MSAAQSIQQLFAMVTGHWVTASLHTVTVLRIPDLLAAGPRSAEEIAAATRTQPDPLRRLLCALAAHGVFAEREDGRFAHTEMSNLLRDDIVPSMRPFVLLFGSDVQWAPWREMLHSIQTGETAFSKVHGAELFEYMKSDPEESAIFDRAMTQSTARSAAEIVSAYDFSRFGTIVDVGGGQGGLISAILAAVPAARGILFDQPHVLEKARAVVTERGVADRCQLVGGSFFESVPRGGDAYIMRAIIHDWDDGDAAKILRNVRAVIPADGTLVVLDRVLPERITAGDPVLQSATLMDLNMLVNVTGRERTEAQFRTLLTASGFRVAQTRTTASGLGFVEGVPA